jgi:hypothetical protein
MSPLKSMGSESAAPILFPTSDDHALKAAVGRLLFVDCQSRCFHVNLAQW